MHVYTLKNWQHDHDFAVKSEKGEQRARAVLIITALTMIVEIIAGSLFGSMALLADGWHMGTHVAAFMMVLYAYRYARNHADDPSFTFGTGKVSVLGGFASSVALLVVAFVMGLESILRMIKPEEIQFNKAIGVAVLGLFVNIACAFILKRPHHHSAKEAQHHHDYNLNAAFFHVMADALTSIFAIVALICGRLFGWNWLDSTMGIVGALMISRWSYGLIKETGPILLDASVEEEVKEEIKKRIESESDNRIADLHLWRVGPDHYAAIISIVTHFPMAPDHYKALLNDLTQLSHVTIEINQCYGEPCIVPAPSASSRE